MMEAHLGVTTCDKCQEPMKKGQPVLAITEGIADGQPRISC